MKRNIRGKVRLSKVILCYYIFLAVFGGNRCHEPTKNGDNETNELYYPGLGVGMPRTPGMADDGEKYRNLIAERINTAVHSAMKC